MIEIVTPCDNLIRKDLVISVGDLAMQVVTLAVLWAATFGRKKN